MQELLSSNCSCNIAPGVTAISPENAINSFYCGFRLRPDQFRLEQPFQRANTSRQQVAQTLHAGSKRQREEDNDVSIISAAEDAGQQLQQHIQTIIRAHQQLLHQLGPVAAHRGTKESSAAALQEDHISLQDPDSKPMGKSQSQPSPKTVDSEQAAAVTNSSQHSAFESEACCQEHAAVYQTADASAAVRAAVPSTDWPALAAMRHILKPKISFSYNLPGGQLRQHSHMRFITANLFNSLILNPSTSEVLATAYDQDILLPAQSSFYMSDLKAIHPFLQAVEARGGASLLVIDPPWENASARRSAAYNTLTPNHLLYLPVKQLARQDSGSLIALWMTNRPRLHKFVKQQLLPCWGLQHVATWLWLKVTDRGEPISPLDSLHRHPFEQLWLLRVQRQKSDAAGITTAILQQEQQQQQGVQALKQTPQQQQMEPGVFQQLQQEGMPGAAAVKHPLQEHKESLAASGAGAQEMLTAIHPLSPGQRDSAVSYSHGVSAEVAVEQPAAAAATVAAVEAAVGRADTGFDEVVQPPDNHVIISVPGQHSRKPHLGKLLIPYLSPKLQQQQQQQRIQAAGAAGNIIGPSKVSVAAIGSADGFQRVAQYDGPVCVELFARELFPGWMSWGNEPIKLQTMDYWVEQDTH